MSFKATIFFLVALVLTQDVLGSHVNDEEMARGVMDKVKDALQKLEKMIGELVLQALNSLANLNLTPELNKFIAQINEIITKAMAKIDELQDQANKLGVDVSSCIVNNKETIKNIGISVVRDLQGCGTSKLNEALAIIDSASRKVQNTLEEVKAIAKRFSECGSGVASVPCYTKVSGEIAKAVIELPATISKEVTQAMSLVSTLKGDLENCALEKLSSAAPKVEEIVKTVADCIKEKL